MRLVQGQMGIVLADYAARPDESDHRSRSRCRKARVRCDDADEEDRHRCNRGGASRLRWQLRRVHIGSKAHSGRPTPLGPGLRLSTPGTIVAAARDPAVVRYGSTAVVGRDPLTGTVGQQRTLSDVSGLSPDRTLMRIYCLHWCPVHAPQYRDSSERSRRENRSLVATRSVPTNKQVRTPASVGYLSGGGKR